MLVKPRSHRCPIHIAKETKYSTPPRKNTRLQKQASNVMKARDTKPPTNIDITTTYLKTVYIIVRALARHLLGKTKNSSLKYQKFL